MKKLPSTTKEKEHKQTKSPRTKPGRHKKKPYRGQGKP